MPTYEYACDACKHGFECLSGLCDFRGAICPGVCARVVGAGQSAAEVVAYLHRTYPRAEVHAVFGEGLGGAPGDPPTAARRPAGPGGV